MAAADGEHFDTPALTRLGAWGIGAFIALITVIIVGSTAGGGKRVSAAFDSFKGTPPRPTAAQLLAQAKESESDPRRLSDAVRLLTFDRDRLANRLAALERNLEDLTGSISRTPPVEAPRPAAPEIDLPALPSRPAVPPAAERDNPGTPPRPSPAPPPVAKQPPPPIESPSQSSASVPNPPPAPGGRTPAGTVAAPAAPRAPGQPPAPPPSIISPTPLSTSAPLGNPPLIAPPDTIPARTVTPTPAPPPSAAARNADPQDNAAPLAAPELAPPKLVTPPPEAPRSTPPVVAASPFVPTPRASKLASAPLAHAIVPTDPPAPGRQTRVSRKRITHSKAVPMEAAADSIATKTEFAVDLGGAQNVEGLRLLWSSIRSNQPSLVDQLRPVIAVRETEKSGTVELRLVVGPLANAAAAARLCASFSSAGRACEPAIFDGQKLALR
jgi:hypothetical protein